MLRIALKTSAIAFASMIFLANPAWAGTTCVLVDEDGNVDNSPSPNPGINNLECGNSNNYDLDENEDLIPPGVFSTAVGSNNLSAGEESTAVGYNNKVLGDFASAVGDQNIASGVGSNAFGGGYLLDTTAAQRNRATGDYSNAFGVGNLASGRQSSAFGFNNIAESFGSNAFGENNEARASGNAFGSDNHALGGASNAYGYSNYAYGTASSVFGVSNRAAGYAFGRENDVGGLHSSAIGYSNEVGGDFSVALGSNAQIGALELDNVGNPVLDANGLPIVLEGANYAIALGASGFDDEPTRIGGGAHDAIAIGRGVDIANGATDAIALGRASQVTVAGGVAIGAGSVADRAGTVSFGNDGMMRQLVNVADGTEATDAVNLSQLQDTLATANAYTDTAVATGGTQANAYTDNREAAVREDMAAGDAQTLSQANAYTDTRMSEIGSLADDFDAFRGDVNRRISMQDDRIDRVGALGSAMIGMAASAAAVEGSRTRIGVAAGTYGGKQALSVGLQQRFGSRVALTLGGGFSGSERSAMVGLGFGL